MTKHLFGTTSPGIHSIFFYIHLITSPLPVLIWPDTFLQTFYLNSSCTYLTIPLPSPICPDLYLQPFHHNHLCTHLTLTLPSLIWHDLFMHPFTLSVAFVWHSIFKHSFSLTFSCNHWPHLPMYSFGLTSFSFWRALFLHSFNLTSPYVHLTYPLRDLSWPELFVNAFVPTFSCTWHYNDSAYKHIVIYAASAGTQEQSFIVGM